MPKKRRKPGKRAGGEQGSPLGTLFSAIAGAAAGYAAAGKIFGNQEGGPVFNAARDAMKTEPKKRSINTSSIEEIEFEMVPDPDQKQIGNECANNSQ